MIDYLERGDIKESSFAFTVDYQNDCVEWVDRSDDGKIYLRKVKKIKKLYDVSPVVVPAYEGTSVGVAQRELKDFTSAKNDELSQIKAEEQRKVEIEQEELERKLNEVYTTKETIG